jgi:hypothetical protein
MPRHADPALEAVWRRRLRRQPDSGLTIHQFCQREGVSTAAFHAWKRRLALRAAFPTAPAFVPVIVSPGHESLPPAAAALVTIRLANGGQIAIPVTAGVELVVAVVAVVAAMAGVSATGEGLSC